MSYRRAFEREALNKLGTVLDGTTRRRDIARLGAHSNELQVRNLCAVEWEDKGAASQARIAVMRYQLIKLSGDFRLMRKKRPVQEKSSRHLPI